MVVVSHTLHVAGNMAAMIYVTLVIFSLDINASLMFMIYIVLFDK